MKKWEKASLWILAVIIGVLLIGSFFGADFRGLIGVIIIFVSLIILETATQDMKRKWGAFWIRIGIMLIVVYIMGIIFNFSSENGGKLLSFIIILELFQTISKKKVNKKV
jgi:hypothetical protein